MDNIENIKKTFPTFFSFIDRYDQDFWYDFQDEKVYWEEFFEHDYTVKKVDNILIIRNLLIEMNKILEIPDSDDFWKMHQGIWKLTRYFPTTKEARVWIESVRDYMQEKLDNKQ